MTFRLLRVSFSFSVFITLNTLSIMHPAPSASMLQPMALPSVSAVLNEGFLHLTSIFVKTGPIIISWRTVSQYPSVKSIWFSKLAPRGYSV